MSVAIAAVDGGDQQTYTLTEPGEYNYTVDGAVLNGTCLNQMCCPVVVVLGDCTPDCIPSICLPIIITRIG